MISQVEFNTMIEDMRIVTREGDRVRVRAPEGSLAFQYNGQDGTICSYTKGWVNVSLDQGAYVRFRGDELLTL